MSFDASPIVGPQPRRPVDTGSVVRRVSAPGSTRGYVPTPLSGLKTTDPRAGLRVPEGRRNVAPGGTRGGHPATTYTAAAPPRPAPSPGHTPAAATGPPPRPPPRPGCPGTRTPPSPTPPAAAPGRRAAPGRPTAASRRG